MVARIKRTQSLSRSLNYNEKKVQSGVAECIHAVNYPKDIESLTFYDKLHRLEHQAALNERVQTNSVHISLNFHEADRLSKQKLCSIAEDYMKGIGFENQPYVVYQHHDAAHPHIHIVSTNIQRDGSKIDMQNIGRNQSEKARENIEQQYGLIKAEGLGQKINNDLNQENEIKVIAQIIHYGKSPTKRAIANVLDEVINQYKYTSLAELNAVLKLYNVVADRGKEDNKMYQQKGLVYFIVDDKGNKIGIPIKASAFYNKPTLPFLENKFVENEKQKEAYSKRLKTSIKWVLVKKELTLGGFTDALAKEGIKLVIRQSSKGDIYGLTYIDLKNKCVFNGSDLGKEFSAKGILEQLNIAPQLDKVLKPQDIDNNIKPSNEINYTGENKMKEQRIVSDRKEHLSNMMQFLLKSEENNNSVSNELLKKKSRKKKRKLNW